MKKKVRVFFIIIAAYVIRFISPVLDLIDACYAARKYKSLMKHTHKMYAQYLYTKRLYFINGGFEVNKETIASRAKILKQNAETVTEGLSMLNENWADCLTDDSRENIRRELGIFKEIKKFGEEFCQKESA